MKLIALRVVLSSLAYMVALAAVLVVGLGIWTEFHISLRSLGPDTLVFLSLFVFLGVPVFGATTWLSRRKLLVANHFSSVVLLYVFVVGMLLMIAARPPQGIGLQGGDMVALAAVLVVGLGIWTEFHISLRSLGPDTLVFLSLFVFSRGPCIRGNDLVIEAQTTSCQSFLFGCSPVCFCGRNVVDDRGPSSAGYWPSRR